MPYDRTGHLQRDASRRARAYDTEQDQLSSSKNVAAKKKVFKKITHIEEELVEEEQEMQQEQQIRRLEEHELDHAAHVCSEHCRYGDHYYPGYGYYPDCGQFGYPEHGGYYGHRGNECGNLERNCRDPRGDVYIHPRYPSCDNSYQRHSARNQSFPDSHGSYPSAHRPSCAGQSCRKY